MTEYEDAACAESVFWSERMYVMEKRRCRNAQHLHDGESPKPVFQDGKTAVGITFLYFPGNENVVYPYPKQICQNDDVVESRERIS